MIESAATGKSMLETARTDPQRVDVEAVMALCDAEGRRVRTLALRSLLLVATDDPDRVAAVAGAVVDRLHDESPVAGATAAAVLSRIANDHPDAVRPAVPALVAKLDEHPPSTGYRAVRALSPVLGTDPGAFVPQADALVSVLVDPPTVRAPSSAELQALPGRERQERARLLSSRRSELSTDRARTTAVRAFAAHALVEVTDRAPLAVAGRIEELPPALADDRPTVRAATADAVANVAAAEPAAATPAVDALIDLLRDDAEFVRAHAVRALGFAEATAAVGPLRKLAADDVDPELRELAADTAAWLADAAADGR